MDLVTVVGSLIEIIGGLVILYILIKPKGMIAFGVGGPLILLGMVLLAIAYGLISGLVVWIMTGTALIILGSSSYMVLRGTKKI